MAIPSSWKEKGLAAAVRAYGEAYTVLWMGRTEGDCFLEFNKLLPVAFDIQGLRPWPAADIVRQLSRLLAEKSRGSYLQTSHRRAAFIASKVDSLAGSENADVRQV